MEGIFKTEVDLAGLMKVLGDNLYSTPNVALRELVQNGHDSCRRRQIEAGEGFEPRIVVRPDPVNRALHIEDTGAGLTREEVIGFLARVGAGYTRTLRDAGHDEGLIGYFGLGFLSAFVVSEHTQVHTCSWQDPSQAWLFDSRTGETYTLRPGAPRAVGTTVTLRLKPAFERLCRPEIVATLLRRYCCLLNFPVFCEDTQVNAEAAPWRDAELELDTPAWRRVALEFAQRFEPSFEPLFTLPLPAGGAAARHGVQGLLWGQSGSSYGSLDNRRAWIFVRGMMVCDDERDVLPRWAGFCGAVVACDALTPTASREAIQKDEVFEAVAEEVRAALVEGMARLASRNRAAWERFLLRHNEALRGAAVADPDVFRLLADELTVPTSEGELTVGAVLRRSPGRLYVSQGERRGFEELLFRALKVPVIDGTRYAALAFCRRQADTRHLDLLILGTNTGDSAFFERASLGAEQDAQLRAWFAEEGVEVVISRFRPEHLPLVLVPDREAALKQRIESDQANARIASAALSLARLYTARLSGPAAHLYVNVACPVIARLLDAPEGRRDTALALLRALVAMNAEHTQEGVYMGVDEALATWCDAVARVLELDS